MTTHNILFVASEAVPFAKVGGLADVISALSKALIKEKQNVKIILPKHRSVTKYMNTHHIKIQHSYNVSINIEGIEYPFTIEEVPYGENNFIFIDMPQLFDRDTLYTDPVTGKDYTDNLIRYVFFNRAVLETCKVISWIPNIIHCHDWHIGLLPIYMESLPEYKSVFMNTHTVFTIHNLAYQGVFSVDQYPQLGLDWKYFHVNGLEYYRHINLLKGGICFADAVNTVSPTYAQEIKTASLGSGLDGVIREKEINGIFTGIMNGVDYSEWDPSYDDYLKKSYHITYDINTLQNKALIKEEFFKANGLSLEENIPLIGIITRLYDQKGIDILLECLEELLNQKIAFTILGTGKKEYELRLLELSKEYPEYLNVVIDFSIERSHEIEAASDIFLMPSQFEPCGLNQLYSLRYGTIPIVRKTGGLADSVVDGKTGFVFSDYHPDALKKSILRAVDIWKNDKLTWNKMIKTGMKENWSWKRSAKGYLALYNQILEN